MELMFASQGVEIESPTPYKDAMRVSNQYIVNTLTLPDYNLICNNLFDFQQRKPIRTHIKCPLNYFAEVDDEKNVDVISRLIYNVVKTLC